MALDKKTKDIDASVELLEDRLKYSKWCFILFYLIGLFIVFLSVSFLPYKWDESGIGIGLTFLIIGGYFLIITISLSNLIYLKRQFEKRDK